MTMTQSLLDFILSLLRDSDAKAAFLANPDKALADAGLSDVCSEDISDAMSYVAEYHPVTLIGSREYNLGNSAVSQHASDHRPDHDDRPEAYHPGPHATPVQQLEYITNNYTYTDSHDTLIDKSVNQSIWNEGVLHQQFDDHSVTATDQSVAAGRDIDGNVANGDGNVVGDGNDVGNTYYRDDHSQDNSTHGSFNGSNIADRGSVAGNDNDGNVTKPDHSAAATNGSGLDASTNDSHDTTVSDSFKDSHDRESHTHTKIDSHNDNSHDDNSHNTTLYPHSHQSFNDESFNHDFNNHESYNDHSAISHTEQSGLINANVSPALNLPIDHNDVEVLSPDTA
jgi:hypothetical protein